MSLHDILSDYRMAVECGMSDFAVQLVFSALRVGGSYVNHNPDTLAFDLLGRLLVYYDKNVGVKDLLQQCDTHGLNHSSMVPLYQCFESPRAMLLYVLEDHMQVGLVAYWVTVLNGPLSSIWPHLLVWRKGNINRTVSVL